MNKINPLIEDHEFKLGKLNSAEVLGASDDDTVSEQAFVEGQENQVWIQKIPKNEKDNFFTLRNKGVQKLLTPESTEKLEVRGN